jgi:hypothetical protein
MAVLQSYEVVATLLFPNVRSCFFFVLVSYTKYANYIKQDSFCNAE